MFRLPTRGCGGGILGSLVHVGVRRTSTLDTAPYVWQGELQETGAVCFNARHSFGNVNLKTKDLFKGGRQRTHGESPGSNGFGVTFSVSSSVAHNATQPVASR